MSFPHAVVVMVMLLCCAATASSASAGSASFEVFDQRARDGRPLSVVFFGGSLTWGANATDPQRTSYRALMGDYLRQKYPKASFAFHDAAIGGTGSRLGMFRLERDVLSRKPDLVFLDFSVNDNPTNTDIQTLASYEGILRDMVGRDIPVVQVLLGLRSHFGPQWDPPSLHRVNDHRTLAKAYHTGTGDCFPLIQKALTEGTYQPEQIWPFDGTHPDDLGYRLFFEAARDGFEEAVREKRVCVVPEKPVFSDQYHVRRRIRLAELSLPAKWQVVRTYRTSFWFDGLSSRWMGDVAMCDLKDKAAIQPFKVEFSGTFVGVFGEADENGLSFKALVDGKPMPFKPGANAAPSDIWPFDAKQFGTGRLFMWRELADDLPPGKHVLEIQPVFDPAATTGQLRIESICVAGE